jgi:transcriptional regulator with XRE-family HTH domain
MVDRLAVSSIHATLSRVRRKVRVWGIPVSYLAKELGVSRQYAWQLVHYRTPISLARARELEVRVDEVIRGRRHLSSMGNHLRAARIAAGLTLKEVAQMIGYSWVGVERWERDVCLPKPGVLWHLLSLYGVQASGQTEGRSGRAGHLAERGSGGAREELAIALTAMSGSSAALRPAASWSNRTQSPLSAAGGM